MRKLLILSTTLLLLLVGCEYDNYDAPKSTLSGRVVYNGEQVGVRTGGTQLELWQHGYDLFEKIPVHIAHDGTFSALLFDGDYKLVRLAGAPWQNQTDTIDVTVSGNTVKDVDVVPYYTVSGETYTKSSDVITAKFTVSRITSDANVASVRVYLGKNFLTDQNRHFKAVDVDLSEYDVTNDVITITQEVEIPSGLKDYAFARVGVRSDKSNEYYYTQVEKVEF